MAESRVRSPQEGHYVQGVVPLRYADGSRADVPPFGDLIADVRTALAGEAAVQHLELYGRGRVAIEVLADDDARSHGIPDHVRPVVIAVIGWPVRPRTDLATGQYL